MLSLATFSYTDYLVLVIGSLMACIANYYMDFLEGSAATKCYSARVAITFDMD